MKVWFLADTCRLAQEKAAVEALVAAEDWFLLDRWKFHAGALAAVGTITVHGKQYPVRLMYPDQFPEVPPWVQPQDPARWSAHQFGTAELCLELRADNWVTAATGADMLRSAYSLLRYEDPANQQENAPHAPSAHHVSGIQAYGSQLMAVFIGAGCNERLAAGQAVELKAFLQMPQDTLIPIFLHDSVDRKALRRPPADDVASARSETPIFVIRKPRPAEVSRETIVAIGEFEAAANDLITGKGAALIVFTDGATSTAYYLFDGDGPYQCQLVILPDQQDVRSGRTANAADKRVAVIGAGSVGAKIADSLVRSGISRLLVADGDVLLPANLERHVLDWRDVGFRKVTALKRHLLQIMPGADITVFEQNLNWQRSARTHSLITSGIAACDVIIDATGDPATTLFLGAVAAANGRAYVSVVVFEGGIGALIASCIPGRDPTYVTARANYQAWCDQQNERPPQSGARPYEALEDNQVPLVADDAAVTMTAGHAARVVLDTLDGLTPDPKAAWLLIGYRKAWVFDGHGHTIRMSVGTPPEPQPDVDDRAAAEWVLELLKERTSADPAGQ